MNKRNTSKEKQKKNKGYPYRKLNRIVKGREGISMSDMVSRICKNCETKLQEVNKK